MFQLSHGRTKLLCRKVANGREKCDFYFLVIGGIGVVPGGNGGGGGWPLLLEIARVRNQQSIGSGLPFITTGPRYSRWNDGSWLTGSQRSLEKIRIIKFYEFTYINMVI